MDKRVEAEDGLIFASKALSLSQIAGSHEEAILASLKT
jgi:hypothetical protein